MKKIISVFLAIVMCLTMTTVAFAAKEETPEVSKDGIISVLLEAAKIASSLNDDAREAMSEEIEKLLVEQIAGDNVFFQQAAQWILDNALKLSGAENILTLDKNQAEKIADFLTKVYDGNLGEYVDSPLIKLIITFVPEEVFKEAVVWLLSDGLGDTLQDFIDKYGDGESGEKPEVEQKPETEKPEASNPLEGMDWSVAIDAAVQAVKDFFSLLVNAITEFFNGFTSTTPAPAA